MDTKQRNNLYSRGFRICSKCSATKTIKEFSYYKYGSNGLRPSCKVCRAAEKRIARLKLMQGTKRSNGKITYRYSTQSKFKTKIRICYSLTVLEYAWLLHSQDFRCAACSRTLDAGHSTHLDHCHTSGKVRGFLCAGCNVGIGAFKEDTSAMYGAIGYLYATM